MRLTGCWKNKIASAPLGSILTSKPEIVKLSNPQKGEENLVYIIVDRNEPLNRVSISCININMRIPGIEVVSDSEIEYIK